jgi:bacterial/archaeal transporter family-2 protein
MLPTCRMESNPSCQLTTGMVIDNFGWFENSVIHFDMKRLAGVVLMFIALYFILKTKPETQMGQEYKAA